MKPNPIIGEVRWERIPIVAESPDPKCRGLAPNTLEAYGRNLERYLSFLEADGIQPWEVRQNNVGAYLRSLTAGVTKTETRDAEKTTLANATIQQHLATLRLFYDYLVEEQRCTAASFLRELTGRFIDLRRQ